jgi:hypothetical protein
MASNGFGRVRFLPIFEYFVDYKALLGFASYIFDGGGGVGLTPPFRGFSHRPI